MNLRAALASTAGAALALTGCAAPAPSPLPEVSASPLATPASPTTSPATTTAPPTAAAPRPTRTQPPEIAVDSVWNFRDVAGTAAGLPLADGGQMARGVVFRSGKLKGLSAADRRDLVRAGVTDIFDLRTDEVAARTPDPEVGKAKYHLVNVYAVYSRTDPPATDAEEAREQREQMYRDFVAEPEQRERIGEVLKGIADARGAVIIHCSEGKDRTGWVSALLQAVAGADETTIMDEYLLSNQRRAEIVERAVAKVRNSSGRKAAEIERARLEVAERYLRAALDEVATRYGDLETYLTDGLGLSATTIDLLRAKLRLS